MVRPVVRREVVAHLKAHLGLSERRACQICGFGSIRSLIPATSGPRFRHIRSSLETAAELHFLMSPGDIPVKRFGSCDTAATRVAVRAP